MGSRTTRQRRAVLRALATCPDFVSAQDLYARLVADAHSVGLTTVYRALRELEAEGGVDVVRDDDGGRLYRLRPDDGHRHYLICRCCGRSRPVDSEVVEDWAARIATDTGFAAVEHTVELTGLCADCHLPREEQAARHLTGYEQGEPPCRLEPGSRDRLSSYAH